MRRPIAPGPASACLTEAEWEFAARGGLEGKAFPWGDEREPGGEHRMNVWQGTFPSKNTEADGYYGTCPVDAFPPNGYGLHNATGNVWEWAADWFDPRFRARDRDHDPRGPASGTLKLQKGGSYLCHDSYCRRYRVAARQSNTPDSSAGNVGFRCARDARLTSVRSAIRSSAPPAWLRRVAPGRRSPVGLPSSHGPGRSTRRNCTLSDGYRVGRNGGASRYPRASRRPARGSTT